MTIIIELMGGLGNQLFQYAFGRSLCLETGHAVKFDARAYPDSRGRTFDLPLLQVECDTASERECNALIHPRRGILHRVLTRTGLTSATTNGRRIHHERTWFEFDGDAHRCETSTYLSGYWQCLRYFEHHRDLLVQEMRPRAILSCVATEWLKEIRSSKSVAVHIRRGDYQNPPDGNRFWDVCHEEYYRNASRELPGFDTGLTYFVFSDEPSERDTELFAGDARVVPATLTAIESLCLMSHCQHHIIANSSFSWWGAFLSKDPTGMTVYPSYWTRSMPTPVGLIPREWKVASAPLN